MFASVQLPLKDHSTGNLRIEVRNVSLDDHNNHAQTTFVLVTYCFPHERNTNIQKIIHKTLTT